MNKDKLIGKIAEAYTEFDEQDSTFDIEVYGDFGGFSSISGIEVRDYNGKKLKGEIDLTSDELVDLIIDVIDDAGALKWGSFETTIAVHYADEVIEIHTKATDEIFGEL
jgi:hypothetical protein